MRHKTRKHLDGSGRSLPNVTESIPKDLTPTCIHEWIVFSTALADHCLMLNCIKCAMHASVDHPTEEEWSEAFHAPSRPYLWVDDSRVTIRGQGSHFVIPKMIEAPCECITSGRRLPPDRYERIIGGILTPDRKLTKSEREDFGVLSQVIIDGRLCSLLLPFYLQHFEKDTGIKTAQSVKRISKMIEEFQAKGLHMSPGALSTIFKSWAAS